MRSFRLHSFFLSFFTFIFLIHSSGNSQIIPNRLQVLLKLTPRPSDHITRTREVFFDQKATLRIQASSSDLPSEDVQVQCAFLYDEIQASGKIKRKAFKDILSLTLKPHEEIFIDSKDLRLTGKISKDGQIVGMKFVGSAARVYEKGKLIYELYQPQELQKEFALMVPELNFNPQKELQTKKDPSTTESRSEQVEVGSALNSGHNLFGYTFSPEETQKVLQAVNTLSEEELITQTGLSRKAAQHLIQKRPFQNLEELPKVSYVKKTAIETLKLYAIKK